MPYEGNDGIKRDKYGNKYVPDNRIPEGKKPIFKDAFPEFVKKYDEEHGIKEDIETNDIIQPIGTQNYPEFQHLAHTKPLADTYDNDRIRQSINEGINVSFEISASNVSTGNLFTQFWTPQKKRQPRKKKPVKEYTITVIDTKKQVGVEGKAIVDPNKLDKIRVGRVPKKKRNNKLINEMRKEKEAKAKKQQEIENNKKPYELKLF